MRKDKEILRLEKLLTPDDVADVILKTAVDVEAVKEDIHAVRKKIVEEEAP